MPSTIKAISGQPTFLPTGPMWYLKRAYVVAIEQEEGDRVVVGYMCIFPAGVEGRLVVTVVNPIYRDLLSAEPAAAMVFKPQMSPTFGDEVQFLNAYQGSSDGKLEVYKATVVGSAATTTSFARTLG